MRPLKSSPMLAEHIPSLHFDRADKDPSAGMAVIIYTQSAKSEEITPNWIILKNWRDKYDIRTNGSRLYDQETIYTNALRETLEEVGLIFVTQSNLTIHQGPFKFNHDNYTTCFLLASVNEIFDAEAVHAVIAKRNQQVQNCVMLRNYLVTRDKPTELKIMDEAEQQSTFSKLAATYYAMDPYREPVFPVVATFLERMIRDFGFSGGKPCNRNLLRALTKLFDRINGYTQHQDMQLANWNEMCNLLGPVVNAPNKNALDLILKQPDFQRYNINQFKDFFRCSLIGSDGTKFNFDLYRKTIEQTQRILIDEVNRGSKNILGYADIMVLSHQAHTTVASMHQAESDYPSQLTTGASAGLFRPASSVAIDTSSHSSNTVVKPA